MTLTLVFAGSWPSRSCSTSLAFSAGLIFVSQHLLGSSWRPSRVVVNWPLPFLVKVHMALYYRDRSASTGSTERSCSESALSPRAVGSPCILSKAPSKIGEGDNPIQLRSSILPQFIAKQYNQGASSLRLITAGNLEDYSKPQNKGHLSSVSLRSLCHPCVFRTSLEDGMWFFSERAEAKRNSSAVALFTDSWGFQTVFDSGNSISAWTSVLPQSRLPYRVRQVTALSKFASALPPLCSVALQ